MEVERTKLKTRDSFFDIIKGFAILLVVIGHCIQYGNSADYLNNKEYFENFVFRCIYSFHMPLFMLICGYFFYSSSSKRTLLETVFNKCKTVLLPIISFSIVSYIIWYGPIIRFAFYSIDMKEYLIGCKEHIQQSLWFFWALFKLSIIVAVIQKGLKDNIYIHIFILLLVFILPIPRMSELEKSVYPFFLLGYFAKKYNWWKKLQSINSNIANVSLGISYAICLYYFHKDTYVYTTGVTIWNSDLRYYQILIDIHRFLTGLSGSLICLLLTKSIYEKVQINYIVRLLSFLGIYSGGIYCVHNCLIPVDIFILIIPNNNIPTVGVIFFVLIYSVLISWILSKNKFTNYLFLGGR